MNTGDCDDMNIYDSTIDPTTGIATTTRLTRQQELHLKQRRGGQHQQQLRISDDRRRLDQQGQNMSILLPKALAVVKFGVSAPGGA